MSSASNNLFITLIACLFVISIASAKPAQTDIGLNEHGFSLSRADGNISHNLGLKIANSKPEDQIPVIVFMKKPDKIKTSKTKLLSLLSSAVESGGGKVGRRYNIVDAFSAKMPASRISELSRMPGVERIYYDEIVSLPPQPSEKSILQTNSTQTIGATYVWNTFGYTGTGIKVAIIDSGIDYNHPDLGGGFGPGKKVADGINFVNNNPPLDDFGHGTHVAGIVAANGILKGVAPNATLFAVKVCDSSGSCGTSNTIAGIDWSIAHGANIISMSLGGSTQPNDEFADVTTIVSDAAVEKGVVVVVAAGNEGPGTDTIGAPGSAKKVITVGASDSNDTIASFSSRGPSAFGRLDPDVVAPGVSINSTVPTGACELCAPSGYKIESGTSMATPHVSGAAALLLQKNPALTPAQVRDILMHTSSNLAASNSHVFEKGAGIINLTNAFTYNISASINGDDRWEESVIPGFSTIGTMVLNNNNSYSVNFSFSLEAMTDLEKFNTIPISSFNLPDYVIIDAGSSKTINITFTPPAGVKSAIYGTTLVVANSTAGTLRIPVVITIPQMGSGSIQGTVDDGATTSCINNLFCGDWIYYKLKSYNGTTLKVNLNWADSASDLDLYLFAPNGDLVDLSEQNSGVSEVVTLNNMVYDEYWVAVHAFSLSGSVGYNLNVLYPTGTKGNLAVNPSSLQSVVAGNEVKNFTFSITNDATAKPNLNLSVKKLMPGGNNFSSGTINNTDSLYSLAWDAGSSGINLKNTRYMNVTLQWVNPANDLDLVLGYCTGYCPTETQFNLTRFASTHNNPQLNQPWEKLENVDIQDYLKTFPDFGVFIKNAGNPETYNLTINFTDIAPWSGAAVNQTPISLSPGQTRQVNVTINGSQLTQNVTDLLFAIQDSTEDYAEVPIRINLNNASANAAPTPSPTPTPTPAPMPLLVSSITPNSRNAQVGTPITIFMSVINGGTATATGVSVSQAPPLEPATVSYTPWNGTAFTGPANTPVNIPAGGTANFVLTITATSAFSSSPMTFNVSGTNAAAAPISGVNTLTISGSLVQLPDVIMISTNLNVSTAVNTPTFFAVATSNVGASATGVSLVVTVPSSITGLATQVNQTNPATGAIIGPATGVTINAGAQPSFAVFLTPTQPIAFDPTNNRITLQLKDGSGNVIGAQSIALSTT
ncbi:MAG: S8 family serine peptidase [Candidatus Methanoperedens sp.]|nr:S8 family serine peptidase [Candidatus Methanoperedens sp.]